MFFVSTFFLFSGNVIEMKKLFLLLGLVTFLASCASTTSTSYSGWKSQNSEYTYHSEVRPYSNHTNFSHGYLGGSVNSQARANKIALDGCIRAYSANDCFVYYEGDKFVWNENVAHLKAKEEKEKKEKELVLENKKKIEQENQQEQEVASLLQKQKTCKTLGFEIGKESNGECVLKLMQIEVDLNKIEEEKTVYVQSGDSNKAAELLARQALRQQQMNNSLMLMQQGYNLMKPKPRINCNTTLMGWTCY